MNNIAFYCTDRYLTVKIQQLADKWSFPLTQSRKSATNYRYLIVVEACVPLPGYKLTLAHANIPAQALASIDYDSAKMLHRLNHGGGKKQALAKAMGLNSKKNIKMLDLTAGFGQDSFVIASLGCEVTMIERNPVIAALVDNALTRASSNNIIKDSINRIAFIYCDATDYLAKHKSSFNYDVIYLDPMYPANNKSAKVKRDMAFLKELLADEIENTSALLDIALMTNVKRIVLKRPNEAAILGHPVGQVNSKSTRFDIYTGKA